MLTGGAGPLSTLDARFFAAFKPPGFRTIRPQQIAAAGGTLFVRFTYKVCELRQNQFGGGKFNGGG